MCGLTAARFEAESALLAAARREGEGGIASRDHASDSGIALDWRTDEPPRDGTEFYLLLQTPYRFKAYKPTSNEAKAGKAGRWQAMTEYGCWENCEAPAPGAKWQPHPSSATPTAGQDPGMQNQ